MNVEEIITHYLTTNGFDGLKAPTGICCCDLASLMVCEDPLACSPGHKEDCECDNKCSFHIVVQEGV